MERSRTRVGVLGDRLKGMKLVLMGLRGSGKSTLGGRLASERGLRFIDLDERTPGELGARTVAEAWALFGEPAFREAEVRALRAAIADDPGILALGGGTPTAPGAAEIIRGFKGHAGAARVVYLRASAAVLSARLRASGMAGRPSLTGADPIGEVAAVLAARDPLYMSLADAVVDVGGKSEGEALADLAVLLAG
jgi:shikimate kinase